MSIRLFNPVKIAPLIPLLLYFLIYIIQNLTEEEVSKPVAFHLDVTCSQSSLFVWEQLLLENSVTVSWMRF